MNAREFLKSKGQSAETLGESRYSDVNESVSVVDLMEEHASQKSSGDINELINDVEKILHQHGSDHMKVADLKVLIQKYQL